MHIFLTAPLVEVATGCTFFIKNSPGVSRNGTLRCFSTFAAADEAMGLTVCPVMMVPPEAVLWIPADRNFFTARRAFDFRAGTAPSTAVPAALGQSKMMSITALV